MIDQISCPFPISDYPLITMAHGGGGRLTAQLIDKMFAPAFANDRQEFQHDAAVLPVGSGALALTTDSYVVKPLFFAGGDIGALSIYGTVNDLAMAGAKPLWMSAGFILEEGLPTETLWRVLQSMRAAAAKACIKIVTGDTKVVERGRGDGLYINTSGVGQVLSPKRIHPTSIEVGDKIILSGDVGRHGIAVLAEREGLRFETSIESDLAPLSDAVESLLHTGVPVHCLRDLTRGGLATALVEIKEAAGLSILIEEKEIAVEPGVRGACELLGLDPLFVANEGRFVAFVKASDADAALATLSCRSVSAAARVIGEVKGLVGSRPEVVLRNVYGRERRLERLSGEQLPRIC